MGAMTMAGLLVNVGVLLAISAGAAVVAVRAYRGGPQK
jgi:hypothetical protein